MTETTEEQEVIAQLLIIFISASVGYMLGRSTMKRDLLVGLDSAQRIFHTLKE